MSLLDDVSIVVTPNGYKAGELYAVVPVPVEGAEEVTNGDFANGETDWTFSAQCEVVNNQARILSTDGSFQYISQNNVFDTGKNYKLEFDVISSNGATLGLGGGIPDVQTTTLGRKTIYTSSSVSYLQIKRSSGVTDVVIDNISVKEYTSADMDVTRATAATRVDENGLVNYALGVEEVTNGDFSNGSTDWTPYGSTLVVSNANPYNGNDTALFTALGVGGANITQSISTVVGNTYHLSCYAQYNSGDQSQIEIVGVLEYPNGIGITSGVTTFTYLQTSFTATSTTSVITVRERGGSNNASCYLYDISIKEVNNVPRIDYTGGGCPHILAEPQRTNLIPYSEDFSDSSWLRVGSITTTDNYTTSPSGQNNATRLQWTNATNYMYQSVSHVGSDFTLSIYLKSNTDVSQNVRLFMDNGAQGQDVVVTTQWQRFELTNITTPTQSNRNAGLIKSGSQVGDLDISIWSAQFEEGSYPTSYIPTSGSTVTRNQDIFTRDGIGSLINSTEGVLFLEMAALSNDGTFRNISLNNGTTGQAVRIYYRNQDNKITVLIGSSSSASVTIDVTDALSFNKIAISYKVNDVRVFVNGSLEGTITSVAMPVGLNELALDVANNLPFYGKVRQLQVYDTALTDAQLTSLTT